MVDMTPVTNYNSKEWWLDLKRIYNLRHNYNEVEASSPTNKQLKQLTKTSSSQHSHWKCENDGQSKVQKFY